MLEIVQATLHPVGNQISKEAETRLTRDLRVKLNPNPAKILRDHHLDSTALRPGEESESRRQGNLLRMPLRKRGSGGYPIQQWVFYKELNWFHRLLPLTS